jgi:calcineurin-like phosphoesterase family protein
MGYFFTSDEHYGHDAVIKYCHRPFTTGKEMDAELIKRFNSFVGPNDTTIHAGDFCWGNKEEHAKQYIKQLNGNHIFLKGSHDCWLPNSAPYMWQKLIEGQFVVICHWAMRTWGRSNYNSWQLHGHSHGGLEPIGKQWDIGVDNNHFYPLSFEHIKNIMSMRPDNFNLVKKNE